MSVQITYFVHGTTTDNERGLATGWADGELSELGKRQARELGGLVAHKKFDAVFCSDLKRSADSTEIVFGNKFPIISDKRLKECDYGDFNQKPEKEFKNYENYLNKPFPNGESYKDVEKRIAEFLKFLKQNYDGKNVAIVAHEAPQLALEVLLKGRTWQEAFTENWRRTKSWQPGWDYDLK